MLDPYPDWYRIAMTIAFLLVDIYAFCLFWFGWRRTHLPFLRLIVVLSAIYVVLGVMHLVIACSEENLKAYVFGYHAYHNFGHAMYLIRPLISITSAFASTLMVRWIVRAYPTVNTATKDV